MSRTYTEEELQEQLAIQKERIEAQHFEEATKEVLAKIDKRLNEANGYKATIGKDVKEVKDKVILLEALMTGHISSPYGHAEIQKRFEEQDKIADLFTEDERNQLVAGWRDSVQKIKRKTSLHVIIESWWVRIGIIANVVFALAYLWDSGTIGHIMHLIIGK